MLVGPSDWASMDGQARYALGSVKGIREALKWAGLDYDYGDHAFICTGMDVVS